MKRYSGARFSKVSVAVQRRAASVEYQKQRDEDRKRMEEAYKRLEARQ